MLTRRKPVSGGWQAQNQVSVAGQSVRWLDMVIEPTGRETIAYQLFAAQSERYGPSYVRRQASVGGALGQVWQQAASSPPSIAAAGGRLRVVWSIAPDPGLALGYTQAFIPAAQPVRALNEATNLITGVSINKYGQGVAMTGYRYDALAYPVTDTSVGAGAPMDTQQQHVAGLAPVLGAGREYFVGVQTFTELPFEESLEVFRAQRP
jgi:hypothetical protein